MNARRNICTFYSPTLLLTAAKWENVASEKLVGMGGQNMCHMTNMASEYREVAWGFYFPLVQEGT